MTDLPQRHPLEQELDQSLTFYRPASKAVFLKVGLELMSVGYSAITAVSLMTELFNAIEADYGVAPWIS